MRRKSLSSRIAVAAAIAQCNLLRQPSAFHLTHNQLQATIVVAGHLPLLRIAIRCEPADTET